MAPLHIVFIHGFWEGPAIYKIVAPALEKLGYQVTVPTLPSLGKAASRSPKSPSMYDDSDHIRAAVTNLLDQGNDVLLVGHSGGALTAAQAVQGLNRKTRSEAGKSGCVVRLAFVTGAIFPVGHVHSPAPFFDIQGDKMWCKEPRQLLFNDMSDAEAEEAIKGLQCQPSSGWDGEVMYAGWADIPSAYLVCAADNAIPPNLQQHVAGMAGCSPVDSCDAGHCAPLSKPEAVVDFLKKVAEM